MLTFSKCHKFLIWFSIKALYRRKHQKKSTEPKPGLQYAVRKAKGNIKVCLYHFDHQTTNFW